MWGSLRKAQESRNTNVRTSGREKSVTQGRPQKGSQENAFSHVGQEPCRFQSLVFRVWSKLGGNITGRKSQEWNK